MNILNTMKINLTSYDLYSDGGVIQKNPSLIGGTYAYVIIHEDKIKDKDAGTYTPDDMNTDVVTNNQTELVAALAGFELAFVKGLHIRKFYCDSDVTLGRLYRGWALNNIPAWLVDWHHELVGVIQTTPYELVKGHAGNKWNEYCDQLCRQAGLKLLKGK